MTVVTARTIALFLILLVMAPAAWAQRMAVSGSTANIRSGPGTNHDVIWQVERFYPVQIEKKKGNWYFFVDFQGDRGWIHKSLLNKAKTVITDKDKCNVRYSPGVKKDNVFFQVSEGIPFRVVRRKGNWIQVEHSDGDRGWIHKSLVW